MKIIITATSNKIDSPFNPRFGRTEYFILVDSETMDWEAFLNPSAGTRGGAGPRAVQFIAEKGADIVISGRYGPNAISALGAAGIKAYLAQEGTVDDVLQEYLENRLVQANSASGPGMHGGDH
jgi:predicted Fe-Mo cluster-binding NifX family protein